VSAIELAVEVAGDAFVTEVVVVDVINRVSNVYLYVNYSLNCLFAMTFQLIASLPCCN